VVVDHALGEGLHRCGPAAIERNLAALDLEHGAEGYLRHERRRGRDGGARLLGRRIGGEGWTWHRCRDGKSDNSGKAEHAGLLLPDNVRFGRGVACSDGVRSRAASASSAT
jgi:hypothetical protein